MEKQGDKEKENGDGVKTGKCNKQRGYLCLKCLLIYTIVCLHARFTEACVDTSLGRQ